MGKGDKRTKRGKLRRSIYGKMRRPKNKQKKDRICPPMPQAAVRPSQPDAASDGQ